MGLVEQEVPETTPANEEVFPREEVSEGTDQTQPDQPTTTEDITTTEENKPEEE
ncbi:MAG: hypothetical protein WC346_18220 [Methanogenium sp.]|jgi:hypothetical protein